MIRLGRNCCAGIHVAISGMIPDALWYGKNEEKGIFQMYFFNEYEIKTGLYSILVQ